MRNLFLTLAFVAVIGIPVGSRVAKADTSGDQEQVPADNSRQNTIDRDGVSPTPMDQGTSEVDRTITQQIRRAVTNNNELSMDAKNVKIITQDGVVTLRGSVKNAEEKATIAAVSKSTQGVKRVDNRLEVNERR